LLSKAQARNVANTFENSLATILRFPDVAIGSLDLVGKRDMFQILSWNRELPVITHQTLHSIIAETIKRWPNSPAIAWRDGRLTYAELNHFSDRLAYHLVNLGVRPATLVPICFEKSICAIISMLAVLKAGAGFVPLDPAAPKTRTIAILDSTNRRFILLSSRAAECFQDLVKHTIIVSIPMLHQLRNCTLAMDSRATPTDIAYTIYTSGSTGIPKGVMIEHRAISSTLLSLVKYFKFGPHSRIFQFTAYTFDAALFEIFATFISGGCLCICSDEERLHMAPHVMRELKVNTAFFTPTMLRLIKPVDVPDLKMLLVGGEAIGSDNVEIWGQQSQLHCVYGPTEASIWCMSSRLGQKHIGHDVIGHAIGCQTWIVLPNDHEKLAPVGSIGELVLSGPGLARGYLNDEERTASVFIQKLAWVPNDVQSTRFYKTGDLVRYNSDGTIVFIGRKDSQVKIRGQRVELGEIEHHINSRMEAARRIAVDIITPSDTSENQKVAVFIHLDNEKQIGDGLDLHSLPLPDDFRETLSNKMRSLADHIPSYMIPSYYIGVSSIPWTTSGKLDRKRLVGTVSGLNSEQLKIYTLNHTVKQIASTSMERQLQNLWGQVLGIPSEEISVDDDFFQLGGDSILAMRLSAVASKLNLPITVSQIFGNTKLSTLSSSVEQSTTHSIHLGDRQFFAFRPFELLRNFKSHEELSKNIAKLCNVPTDAVEDAYPCTPLQEGLMALSVLHPGTYLGQRVLRLPPDIDIKRFKNAYQRTTNILPILRTRIVMLEPHGSVQVVLRPETLKWKYLSVLGDAKKETLEEPVSYGGQLVRANIVQEQENQYFVWTAHHALYDGWCLPLIFKHLEKIYNGAPPEDTVSFSLYINHITSSESQNGRTFWAAQFLGNPPKIFPTLPAPNYHPFASSRVSYQIPTLPRRKSDLTLSTILRGAWAILASCYSNSEDVVFGVTLSGRTAPVPGIHEIVGPTISTMPIRVQVDRGDSVAKYLGNVQSQATEMIPFEHFGLQNIARISENAKAAANFQTLMVIQPSASQEQLLGAEFMHNERTEVNAYALILECQLEGRSGLRRRPKSNTCSKSDGNEVYHAVEKGGVELQALFDPGVLSCTKVEMMLKIFECVVRQLIEFPDRCIGDLNGLSSENIPTFLPL
jgi:amino acid adenylation domain-containing protein